MDGGPGVLPASYGGHALVGRKEVGKPGELDRSRGVAGAADDRLVVSVVPGGFVAANVDTGSPVGDCIFVEKDAGGATCLQRLENASPPADNLFAGAPAQDLGGNAIGFGELEPFAEAGSQSVEFSLVGGDAIRRFIGQGTAERGGETIDELVPSLEAAGHDQEVTGLPGSFEEGDHLASLGCAMLADSILDAMA